MNEEGTAGSVPGLVILSLDIQILKGFIPATAVNELNVQVLGVKSKYCDRVEQGGCHATVVLLLVPIDRPGPTLVHSMTEPQSATVLEDERGLGELVIEVDRHELAAQGFFTGHRERQAIEPRRL